MKKLFSALFLAVTLAFVGQASAQTISASMSWTDNSNNEDGFLIERGATTSGPFAEIGRVLPNITAYSDPGLTPGTQYCYRVAAYNQIGKAYSNIACGTVGVQPNQPGNLTVVFIGTP